MASATGPYGTQERLDHGLWDSNNNLTNVCFRDSLAWPIAIASFRHVNSSYAVSCSSGLRLSHYPCVLVCCFRHQFFFPLILAIGSTLIYSNIAAHTTGSTAAVDISSQVSSCIGGAHGVGSSNNMVSFSVLNSSKAHADLLTVFKVTIPTSMPKIIIIATPAPFMLLSAFIFSQLIFQPPESELELGSFGALCSWATGMA